MGKSLVLCWIFTLPIAGGALACEMENQRDVEIGGSPGIDGECSNNGKRVECLSDPISRILTCDGPGGRFSGPGQGMNALVATACGCDAQSAEETEQEQESG
jgi:hypothetical protein